MTDDQTTAIARTPASYKALRTRAIEGYATPREAIKAKCQECMGYTDVAHAIRSCSSRTCSLWAYRPYRDARMAEATDLTAQEAV